MTTLQTPLTLATAVTASATLAAGKHTPCDATSGALTMTLPTPATVGARIRVEKADTSANTVTISGTIRGSAATIILISQFETMELFAESLTSWRVAASHRTTASQDARYDAAGAAGAAQAFAIQRANHTGTQGAGTITGLATVATSGAYTDLSGKPDLSGLGIFYVNPATGNDANSGGSWQTAFATIAAAIAAAVTAAPTSPTARVNLSRGQHPVAATLVVPQGVKLVGQGTLLGQETELVWTGADDGSYVIRTAMDTSTASFTWGELGNFLIRTAASKPGGGSYTNVNGIYARNLQNGARLHDIEVTGMPGTGIMANWANAGVPTDAYPGYCTFERVWSTGNIVNWHIYGGFTSVLYLMCAGDISSQTTDVFILDPPSGGTTGAAAWGNHIFVGFKTEDVGTPTGAGATANYFVINTDAAVGFDGCSARKGSTGTKPWIKYTVVPSSTNTQPGQIPVTLRNCHTSNLPTAVQDSTGTARLKPYVGNAGIPFQIAHWSGQDPAATRVFADDRFVRADSATVLGTPEMGVNKAWTALTGTWGIASNQAYPVTATTNALAVIDAGVADCTIELQTAYTGNPQRLIFRATDALNYMYWQGVGSVAVMVAGTPTTLFASAAWTAGDVLKVVMKGSSYAFYINGALIRVQTDTTYTTQTKHGIGSSGNVAPRFDRFTVTA